MNRRRARNLAIVAALIVACGHGAAAQDLEPRAYSASPINTTFVVAALGRSTGGVLLDPSVPVEDVEAKLGVVTGAIGHTFDLFGRTALGLVAVPFARATATGRVQEQTGEVVRTGWADARLKLSVNLLGGKALRAAEFAKTPRSTIVGVSLSVATPNGQYMPDKLVNLGSNRWSFKPEAGISVPVRNWTLDGYASVIMFTGNDEFYPGASQREQERVYAVQGHVSYTFRPRFWAAFDATWYSGGTTTVDGVRKADLQRNTRGGVTVSVPLGARQSLKGSYSTGATTRIGGDFDTIALAWQMSWVRP